MNDKPPEYMNYKKYKKTNTNSSQNILTLFITTFLIMLVLFTAIAKHFSPKVDVSIGSENTVEAKESGLGVKRFIDNRLRSIQMDDVNENKKISNEQRSKYDEDDENEYFSTELEEKVIIPKSKATTSPKKDIEPVTLDNNSENVISYNTSMKVIVGNYNSIEQAKVAQSILQDAGLGVTPFIKNVNGNYTLQVGSFTSRAKAETLANDLIKNNFPARIIQD